MAQSFRVQVDLEHGGRWTALTDPHGRQWLWSRPDPARFTVRPGDPFVDVGGLEECFPTIGSNPDHGELWTRPWRSEEHRRFSSRASIAAGGATLSRTIRCSPESVEADYCLAAPPGTKFIWAAHTLLELAVGASIHAAPGGARAWPGHTTPVETVWPRPLGIPYDQLGPNNGSAMFCLLLDQSTVSVQDRGHTLRFHLICADQPVSIGLWRNLGGYPWDGTPTYRNVGIEPMLGRVFDLTAAKAGDAARVPDSGEVEWCLTIDNGNRVGSLKS